MELVEKIQQKIEQLSFYQQLAFGILVSHSFMNTYERFVEKENWGNLSILKKIWMFLERIATHKQEINSDLEKLNKELDTVMPDMDDFSGSIYASLALDVCSMLGECLDFVADKNVDNIKNISYIATQSVEFFIADKNNWQPNMPDFEELIASSIEMKDELCFQLELTELLSELAVLENDFFVTQKIKPFVLHLT